MKSKEYYKSLILSQAEELKESIYIIFSPIFFGLFIIFGVVYKAFALSGRQACGHEYPGRCPGLGASAPSGREGNGRQGREGNGRQGREGDGSFCVYFSDIIWCFQRKSVFLWEILN